jgi:pimeloyl-ACP methyl ester carboxylesterase
MSEAIRLPQGEIRYRQWGEGEPVVFVHGFLVDGRLWDGVATRLAEDGARCIVPDWPFGSHKAALTADADLSPPGVAELIAGFLDELGLERATIVGNDSGGAMSQVLAAKHPERVERLVLTNCDMLENFPPTAFQPLMRIAKVPGVLNAMMVPMRFARARRVAFAPFAGTRIEDDLLADWCRPYLTDRGVARDTRKFLLGMDKRHTLAAAEALRAFERPVRFAWGVDDRFFTLGHARRLAAMLPDAEIAEIADAKTFVAIDRPERVAEVVAAAIRQGAPAAG